MLKYDFLGLIRLFISFVYTKIFFTNARIIRLPFDIRNKKQILIGKNFTSGIGCRIEAYSDTKEKVLIFGSNVQINDYVHITASEKIQIGDNVLMASKIYISDSSHGIYSGKEEHSNPTTPPSIRPIHTKPVIIEDNVWLGEHVSVLPGVTIGRGSIVGANSVVSKSLPPNVIAVGIPAKPIKKYNFTNNKWEQIETRI